MIIKENAKKTINTKNYVREPVDDICTEIKNSNSRRIILTGERSCGKSTVLYNLENRGLGTENQCIYTRFDSCGVTGVHNDELFNEEFFKHYYELVLAYNILNYIKENYALTYEENFKRYTLILNEISNQTSHYINKIPFDIDRSESYLDRMLSQAEFTGPILDEFRDILGIESLSIAIDRFDWTNANSAVSQKVLREYFDMFEKTIITTDDIEVFDENRRLELELKDYSFMDICYSSDKDIVKEIIKRRIQFHNCNIKEGYKPFPADNINDNMYQKLAQQTNGDLSLMFSIVGETIDIWQWDDGKCNLEKTMECMTDEGVRKTKLLKAATRKQKLYL